MYILERPEMRGAWAFDSAEELYRVRSVEVRGCGGAKNAQEFKRRLDAGERMKIGVLEAWKCGQCKPATECEHHRLIRATAEMTLDKAISPPDSFFDVWKNAADAEYKGVAYLGAEDTTHDDLQVLSSLYYTDDAEQNTGETKSQAEIE